MKTSPASQCSRWRTSGPLDELDVSNWHLFEKDAIWPWFERLRREDPVHYHSDSRYGLQRITKFDDIKAIDKNHQYFHRNPTSAWLTASLT